MLEVPLTLQTTEDLATYPNCGRRHAQTYGSWTSKFYSDVRPDRQSVGDIC